jgi:molybdopterin molybdotransferase
MIISVDAARESILAWCPPLAPESVSLWDALHRRLAVDVVASHDVPPFRNSAMDGYAVRAEEVGTASSEAPIRLEVVDEVSAGAVPKARVQAGQAVRIMTGAPMPEGANAVVRFEDSSEVWNAAERPPAPWVAIVHPVSQWENVRHAGEDMRTGSTVLTAGTVLKPAHMGVLATLGFGTVSVTRRPKVALLATGDELVPADAPLAPGKIRNANEYTTAALVTEAGGIPIPLGIAPDRTDAIAAKLREGLEMGVDFFLTSAGVSVGDYDVVKEVLADEGKMTFWQVAIKPGRPLAFGQLGRNGHTVPLIGLPGNPVAAMVAFHVFAAPAIRQMAGLPPFITASRAILNEEVYNRGARRHYMRARAWQEPLGQWRVTTRGSGVQVQGAGILTSMVWANCFAIVPEGTTELLAGDEVAIEFF